MGVKVSHKFQVVIPKRVREEMKITKGERLEVRTEKDKIIMYRRAKNYTKALKGLGKEIWKDVDAVEYQRRLRKEWSRWEEKLSS